MNTVTTPNGGIDLDKEFYHRAYTKFINYFTINMEIEFNQKDPAQERALSVDEFMVRDSSFNAIPPPDKVKYVIPKNVVARKGTEFFDKMIGKDTKAT